MDDWICENSELFKRFGGPLTGIQGVPRGSTCTVPVYSEWVRSKHIFLISVVKKLCILTHSVSIIVSLLHVRSNQCYLICSRHMISSRAVTNRFNLSEKTYLYPCVRNIFWVTICYEYHCYRPCRTHWTKPPPPGNISDPTRIRIPAPYSNLQNIEKEKNGCGLHDV